MGIIVKGNNDVLIFHCRVENDYEDLLDELVKLLDKPLFMQKGYFPKAFFDFGCRYLNEDEVMKLLEVLFVKKKVLFYGININENKNKFVNVYPKVIHAGETVNIHEETLFLYGLNRGATIYTSHNLYFLGPVKGKIISRNNDIKIYGHNFENAQIKIMNDIIHDLTYFTSLMIYYDGKKIVVNREEELWQEQL